MATLPFGLPPPTRLMSQTTKSAASEEREACGYSKGYMDEKNSQWEQMVLSDCYWCQASKLG